MSANHILNERRQVSIFLLAVLEAVLNEQVKAKLISHSASRYVLEACKDAACRQGLNNNYDISF